MKRTSKLRICLGIFVLGFGCLLFKASTRRSPGPYGIIDLADLDTAAPITNAEAVYTDVHYYRFTRGLYRLPFWFRGRFEVVSLTSTNGEIHLPADLYHKAQAGLAPKVIIRAPGYYPEVLMRNDFPKSGERRLLKLER